MNLNITAASVKRESGLRLSSRMLAISRPKPIHNKGLWRRRAPTSAAPPAPIMPNRVAAASTCPLLPAKGPRRRRYCR